MKNLIILGGNSKNNIPWIKEMEESYKKDYNVSTLFYDNWDEENKDIDFDLELNKLVEITKEYDEHIIISKSAGSLLALNGITSNLINPKLLVIMGIPLKFLNHFNVDIKDLFNKVLIKTKILVIQQKNDPQGSSQEIEKILTNNVNFIEIPGNNHAYNEISYIKNIIDNFISKNY